ncbi:MAG: DNA methyltransferase [Gemmatimonadaceae bacterium]
MTLSANPFLTEFVEDRQNDRVPAARPLPASSIDILDASRDDVYWFHPYHTKVPPSAIRTLIEHYTQPGDLVLDPFCGSGMTGVAARQTGRHAVLIDLSPIASFIAGVNVTRHDAAKAIDLLNAALTRAEERWGWLYESEERGQRSTVDYFVWSDVFTCPDCDSEFPFFPSGVIHHGNKVETRKTFPCPNCTSELTVRRIQRVMHDGRKAKQLVWVRSSVGRHRHNRPASVFDTELAQRASELSPEHWYPTDRIDPQGYSAQLAQLGDKGITDVSRFLSERNLVIFADLWHAVTSEAHASTRQLAMATLTSIFTTVSERQGYFGGGGGMSGNFYMPIVRMEKNPFEVLRRKLSRLAAAEEAKRDWAGSAIVSVQSATDLSAIPDSAIDFVYTDPPFGANIIYSEMNLALESWIGVRTDPSLEAVIDPSKQEGADRYEGLLREGFQEIFRVLKTDARAAVEFHNASADVWNVIQRVIAATGLVVERILLLDKGTTTILGDIRPGAAKHDLVILCRKGTSAPDDGDAHPIEVDEVWRLVAERRREMGDGDARARQPEMLFDFVVAQCLLRGALVPLSANEFYDELKRRFPTGG